MFTHGVDFVLTLSLQVTSNTLLSGVLKSTTLFLCAYANSKKIIGTAK